MAMLILIVLVIAFLGGFTQLGGGPFYGQGLYFGGALGVIVAVLLVLFLFGSI